MFVFVLHFLPKVDGLHQLIECNVNQQSQQLNAQSVKQQQQQQQQSTNLMPLVTASGTNPLQQLMNDKTSQSMVTSMSPASLSLNSMLQQVNSAAAQNQNIMNILSPSKPSNISELSNSSLISTSSNNSTSDSSILTTTKTSPSGGGRGEGGSTSTSKRTRSTKPSGDQQKDGKYFERRKRNNVAAKKSRDARKQREDEIAIRASFLEKENSILKAQLQTLKDEAMQLRTLLAQKKSNNAHLSSGGAGVINPSCVNCSNCSALAAAAAAVTNCSKTNTPGGGAGPGNLVASNYLSSNNLAQLNAFEHSDTLTNLAASASTSGLANTSLYLQHPNQHRHQII